MNRRPLVLGISAALFSCLVLMVVVAAYLGARLTTIAPDTTNAETTLAPNTRVPASTPSAANTPRATASVAAPSSAPANSASLDALLKAEVHERDLYALTRRLKNISQPIPKVVNDSAPSFKVGDQRVLWVADEPNKKHFTTTATLRYVTPHVYAWVQNGARVDDNALKKSVDIFDGKIYPTDRQFFGSEWSPGVDNDAHVNIFNGFVPGVGGYFSSADEYPSIVNPFSNQGEWFYINTNDVQPGGSNYEGVLAHEFQHMIHWNNHKNADTWLNEGMSELAMKLNGYSVGGSDTAFLRAPDTQLNAWREDPNASVPHYGGSFLFQSYFLERFGEKMTQEVVREQVTGFAGYEAVLDRARTGFHFNDVFQDWVVANILNDPSVGGGRYAYKDLRSKATIQSSATTYPFNKSGGTVHQYATQYVDLKSPAQPGNYSLTFQGSTSVALAGAEPHSGQFFWYSNRGDDSGMMLTRAFDLRSVKQATLSAWLWWDIEKDYDYAYVEVSTDGGATWGTQKGQHTTDSNPNGHNYGNGFTSRSDQWIEERFDLNAYSGKEIMVRFEYLTDDAYNATGLLVDDISIPELNYRDDAENGDGGWQADGFARIGNHLPQKFAVQIVKFGAQTIVTRLALDANNRAQVALQGFGGNVTRVVVAISGLTPVTTETATFTLSVAPQ